MEISTKAQVSGVHQAKCELSLTQNLSEKAGVNLFVTDIFRNTHYYMSRTLLFHVGWKNKKNNRSAILKAFAVIRDDMHIYSSKWLINSKPIPLRSAA